MNVYQYTAYNTQGKKIKGQLEAISETQAYQSLKDKGLQVTDITPRKASILYKEIEFLSPKIKQIDLILFCRQFSTLIGASFSAASAIQVLSQQTENKLLKKTLEEIHVEVRAGTQLSTVFQNYPKIFPPIFINMVRAGEISGNLDDVMDKLASFFEKEHVTKEKIKSALAYPITVTIIAILVTAFLLWQVVPQFVSTFANLGLELPWITRMVMSLSYGLTDYWYIIFPALFLIIFGLYSWSKTKRGSYQLDFIKLKLPIFGPLLQKSAMARFCRTFSSLVGAGVPILQVLNIVTRVINNQVIAKSLAEAQDNLRAGQSIATPLDKSWVFPPMVVQMVSVGEKSGTLDSILDKVADFYEGEVEQTSDRLKSMLEPIMIMVVAGIVGIIVLAILLPTFTIYENL